MSTLPNTSRPCACKPVGSFDYRGSRTILCYEDKRWYKICTASLAT